MISSKHNLFYKTKKLLGIVILAIGIYVLVDPKFTHLKNIANFDLTKAAGICLRLKSQFYTRSIEMNLLIKAQGGVNLSYIDKCGIAFIIFGGIMFVISFMGCMGSYKQIKCLLVLVSVFYKPYHYHTKFLIIL